MVDGVIPGWESYEAAIGACPAQPLAEEIPGRGHALQFGHDGPAKGRTEAAERRQPAEAGELRRAQLVALRGLGGCGLSLACAALRSGRTSWVLATQFIGGTAVVMERFDALSALRLIEQYRITHSRWVPTCLSAC